MNNEKNIKNKKKSLSVIAVLLSICLSCTTARCNGHKREEEHNIENNIVSTDVPEMTSDVIIVTTPSVSPTLTPTSTPIPTPTVSPKPTKKPHTNNEGNKIDETPSMTPVITPKPEKTIDPIITSAPERTASPNPDHKGDHGIGSEGEVDFGADAPNREENNSSQVDHKEDPGIGSEGEIDFGALSGENDTINYNFENFLIEYYEKISLQNNNYVRKLKM